MRKLVVGNIMSVDGYYDGPGRDVMVMPQEPGGRSWSSAAAPSGTTCSPMAWSTSST